MSRICRRASSVLIFLAAMSSMLTAQDRGLRLEGLDTGEFREAQLAGGDTIIVYWASWSPKCQDIVERVNALASRWSQDARILMVDFKEEPSEARRFLEGKAPKVPVYLDRSGAFAKKHGVTTLPSLLLFRSGKKLYGGALPADAERLIEKTFQK